MTTNNLQIPCQKIISGGQTGADRATLDACLELDFECGGWCPRGRLAEDGPIALKYPLRETNEADYSIRTRFNVRDSDGTLLIAPDKLTGGTLLTFEIAVEMNRPVFHASSATRVLSIINWIVLNNIKTLNIAGPRQSEWPEAYDSSYRLISKLIGQIRKMTHSC